MRKNRQPHLGRENFDAIVFSKLTRREAALEETETQLRVAPVACRLGVTALLVVLALAALALGQSEIAAKAVAAVVSLFR